jgi:hypothetical protein
MMIKILKGIWYNDDGFISDLHGRECMIEILDGKAYDACLGQDFGPITIGEDCVLSYWAGAYFSPDAGELARVGLAPGAGGPQ